MTRKNGEPPKKAPVPRQDRGFLHLGVSLPRFVTVRQPIFNHSPTAFQPPVVRFSPLVRPTFCRAHSPASHPHFTYSCTHHPPAAQTFGNRPSTAQQPIPNHLPIAFKPPISRSSPAPPPICCDKAGHPHPSHAATKPNAQTLQPQLSHTARPTVPYEQF